MMLRSAWMLLVALHSAAAVFFHEQSSVVLTPADGRQNSSFGFSLGYQNGEQRYLVIGAPRYDQTGRVYQRAIEEVLSGRTACEPIDINFDALRVVYNRSQSPDQYFYLGASIAATKKSFLTCAPLRTAFSKGNTGKSYGAYGVCFNYDKENGARKWNGPGLDYRLERKQDVTNAIYGGTGWTTLVNEDEDRIIVAKSFAHGDVAVGHVSRPDSHYLSFTDNYKLFTRNTYYEGHGLAMTSGNYFDKETTYYAFSWKQKNNTHAINFYNYVTNIGRWRLHSVLLDPVVGSVFGAALCSADVTGDARAELVAGAPAYVTDSRSYDRGAVHVYTRQAVSEIKGGKKLDLVLTILGIHDGAWFGSTLSANDVDKDGYPEIFVSAPFENSGIGALYVICGYELHKTIKRTKKVTIMEFKRTQKIQKEDHQLFGFSLQPISDFNSNGGDELGVGSPGNSKVTLFKGVRAVTANVTSRFLGEPSVTDTGYIFSSCVTVDLPPTPNKISTKLSVKNVLNSNDAIFKNSHDANYQIDLSTKGKKTADGKTEYCKELYIVSTSYSKVTTNVTLVDNIETRKDFDNTWVTLSAQSILEKSVSLLCICNDTSCTPDLRVNVEWTGGSNQTQYLVGSSNSENATISVHNRGTMGCNSCAKVRVSGALVEQLQCQFDEASEEYECMLRNPFKANSSQTIDILLTMDKTSNRDKGLQIDVAVRKNCEVNEEIREALVIPYHFSTEEVIVNGSCMNRNISDTELLDKTEDTITDEHTYAIINNHSITWIEVWANITVPKKPYILEYRMKEAEKCIEENDTDTFHAKCRLTLQPYSTVKLTLSTKILKNVITNYLQDWKITIASELILELLPNETKNRTLTTVMLFQKEQTFGQNTALIVALAIIIALLMLLVITFILYKLKFFRRKNKEELKELKQEIRKRSVRRNTSVRTISNQHLSNCDFADMVIVDECPFDEAAASEEKDAAPAANDSKAAEQKHQKEK